MMKNLLISSVVLLTTLPFSSADAELLYGISGCDGLGLFTVDTDARTAVEGVGSYCGQDVEIDESDPTRFHNVVDSSYNLFEISTGTLITEIEITGFPGEFDAVTALEQVNGVMYAALAVVGNSEQVPEFGTLNVTTGALTPIGTLTGMGAPVGGLHFLNGTMYAISAGGSIPGNLYSVDLETGAATLIAPITFDGAPVTAVSALTYSGGKMLVSRSVNANDTNLYNINLSTGVLTVEFDMGVSINGLTNVREPSARNGLAVDGGYIKIDTTGGIAPLDIECSLPEHRGRMTLDETGAGVLYICAENGWSEY